MDLIEVRRVLRQSMDADRYACKVRYVDGKGVETERVVSPIRFVGESRVLAMCMGRQECRQFRVNRFRSVVRINASDVLMPETLTEFVT
jgi:predicted DNA-binding transcriptional regulator YafY